MSQLFTQNDAWSGGFYELVMELPDASGNTRKSALNHLWAVPSLEGCFLRSDIEPSNQQKVLAANHDLEGHLYGKATLPNAARSCCGSIWGDYQESGCWLTFYLPLGSLSEGYPVKAYPFNIKEEPSPEIWIQEINNWLIDIAKILYQNLRFKVGVIGFEAEIFDVKDKLDDGIPSERWDGILMPQGNELIWYPPTTFEPPISFG